MSWTISLRRFVVCLFVGKTPSVPLLSIYIAVRTGFKRNSQFLVSEDKPSYWHKCLITGWDFFHELFSPNNSNSNAMSLFSVNRSEQVDK